MAPPPSPPIVRNLTSIFVRYRHDRRGGGRMRLGFSDHKSGFQQLDPEIGSSRGTSTEMLELPLPPEWTDAAQDAQEELKNIKDKLVQLTKAQQKRLLKVFVDDAAPDREVEQTSNQVSALIRRCEQHVHQVKTRGGPDKCPKKMQCRENVQRNLATQLQQLSQQFRQTQKDYMMEIRTRQRGALWDDGPEESSSSGGKALNIGFNDAQLQELDSMTVDATQRSQEITQIATSINELHTIFKELAVLVIDQGSILDRIDYNIESVVEQTQHANRQLQKAEKSQKSNRAMKCILILTVIDLILIVLLVIKARQ